MILALSIVIALSILYIVGDFYIYILNKKFVYRKRRMKILFIKVPVVLCSTCGQKIFQE